jgi:hypothetical protein
MPTVDNVATLDGLWWLLGMLVKGHSGPAEVGTDLSEASSCEERL